ncbi:hypothetical protein FOZ63_025795 [Perkinsus olseni]|uniref:Uncharacterized protein n=1 Tax=Perkinsus olseni TaxID=32597 RepID=A0A7J6STB0_PEROL|nr:hypothetical protein FOZ60_001121 [Perkinsus olseni]KAF4736025.1 hypothetical protein FOZ63_025795 [Perkinsus olseni]KAF4748162.1 hypothetical protein FOZ62_022670 [Perkinsus olseni]
MASLSLLPPGLVLEGLDAAVSEIDVRQAALVKAYLINTYVGDHKVFTPARWCTRYRVHANLARTNNDIEGFHSTIASKFNRTHPVFWTWADAVNNSMAGVYVDVVHAIRGDKHVRHPIDVIHDARIQEFVFTNVPTIGTDMAEWLSKARAITRAVAPRPEDNRQPPTDGFPSPQAPTSQATSYAPEEDTTPVKRAIRLLGPHNLHRNPQPPP